MTSASFNDFEIWNNADWNQVLTYLDPDSVPINLTGFTGRMDIRTLEPEHTLLVSLETTTGNGSGSGGGNGHMVLGTSNGTITLHLPLSITSTLSAGLFEYDLVLVSGTTHDNIIHGTINVIQGVTV